MIKPSRQMKREADRAFKRFEAKGCHRCGKEPIAGLLEALLRNPAGTLSAVHASCARKDDAVLAVGTFIATTPTHIEDDRQWFEGNPSRLARLRRPFDAGETRLLANHAYIAELKQSGKSPHSDRMREVLRNADPSRVAILVLRKAPGVRLRFVTFLDRDFDEVTVEAIESAGADLIADVCTELPTEGEYLRNLFDVQLLEFSAIAARTTGNPSIADVARAVGESRSATWH